MRTSHLTALMATALLSLVPLGAVAHAASPPEYFALSGDAQPAPEASSAETRSANHFGGGLGVDTNDWMYLLREHGGTLITIVVILILIRWFTKILLDTDNGATNRPDVAPGPDR